ncbi:MAG: hypothetical protein JOY58_03900 [Solirubrobacterales bacterium]|nr:hypothetical protein [Solirubrobacterales bacterium]
MFRRCAPLFVAAALALAIMAASAPVAPAAGPHICSGKFQKPGLLKGTYPKGVVVEGVCAVKTGKARVIGTLIVAKGGALGAAFGRHHSALTVIGNLIVDRGGVAILGCKVNPNGTGMPCLDEPNMNHPTLTSHELVTGNIVEFSPLGVIIHNSSVGGSVKETGGGGGLSCNPPKTGVFAKIMSPVYSDLEDDTVGGNVRINSVDTCWLGLARVKVHGNVALVNNDLADPDGIEVLDSSIGKNLSCSSNTHPGGPPGTMPVWDSAEANPNSMAIYPRISEPNKVGGNRSGQCVTASPITLGGPPAAPAF